MHQRGSSESVEEDEDRFLSSSLRRAALRIDRRTASLRESSVRNEGHPMAAYGPPLRRAAASRGADGGRIVAGIAFAFAFASASKGGEGGVRLGRRRRALNFKTPALLWPAPTNLMPPVRTPTFGRWVATHGARRGRSEVVLLSLLGEPFALNEVVLSCSLHSPRSSQRPPFLRRWTCRRICM